MKSPFTGGNATLMTEETETVFRGETFSYTRYFYRCDDTGVAFTDAETDDKGLEQVLVQYRQKYGIPSPKEIREIREQYGLSAVTMSRILGIGDNQYGLYENGEMPVKNIGRTISTIKDKNILLMYLDCAKNQFPKEEFCKIQQKIVGKPARKIYVVFNQKYADAGNGFSFSFESTVVDEDRKNRWCTLRSAETVALV
ncbi:MAG: hypothetical protein MJZ76_09820 [Bacteroidales bacterium]|nr:hypothetical protein [Bacteroidales bacterium]